MQNAFDILVASFLHFDDSDTQQQSEEVYRDESPSLGNYHGPKREVGMTDAEYWEVIARLRGDGGI